MANYEYQKVDAADGLQAPHSSFLSSGFLTPSSSAYEGRRDSVASSQSSFSYAQSFSSTLYSPQMPPTPSSQREHFMDEMTLVQCQSSFDGSTMTESNEVGFGQCHQDATLSASRGVVEDTASFQDAGWIVVPRQSEYHQARQSPLHHHDVLPAAGDFDSALHSLIASHQVYPELDSSMDLRGRDTTWTAQTSSMLYPTIPVNGLPHEGYAATPESLESNGMQWEWEMLPPEQPLSYSGAPSGTIIPSDAILEADERAYIQMHSDAFESSIGAYDSCSSPMPMSPQEVHPKPQTTEDIKEEPALDESAQRLSSRMYISSTGGKRVKKESRGAALARKRSKSSRPKSTMVHVHGQDMPVEFKMEGGIRRDVNGKWRAEGPGQKKFVCGMEVQGKVCTNSFARPEHLKRHQDTHSGARKFVCIIEECGKRFGRNDNCLEHYWTHVDKPHRKGRNYKDNFLEIQLQIQNSTKITTENKEKILQKLQNKWDVEIGGQKKQVKTRG